MKGSAYFCAAAAVAISGTVAASASAADFYKDQSITMYIGYSAGSNYDAAGRLLARHFGEHVPGKPKIIVKNMPGSSSMKAANYLYNVAEKDGLTIGSIRNGMPLEPLYGAKGVRFDPLKFEWLGSMAKIHGSCVIWHTAPAKTLDDVKKMEIVSGAIGTTASLAMYPRALNAMLGTKFKTVVGYTGTGTLLAMERGETQARCGGDWDALRAVRPDWFRDNKIRLLLQMSNDKHPELQNAPWVFDYVKDPLDVQALRLIFATQEFGRPYLAPPGVPKERVAILRKAFAATVADPAFQADGHKLKMTLIGPLTGQEVEAKIAHYMKTPKAVVDRVKQFQKAQKGEGKVEKKKK